MTGYARLCGSSWREPTRAPATRSRSPATSAAATRFDRALATFAESYADQNERDYKTLTDAVEAGTIKAETGV